MILQISDGKRGEYQLSHEVHEYQFSRSEGALDDDMIILGDVIEPLIETYPDQVRGIWDYAFSEMINNVIDHSEAENVYITVLQNVKETTIIIRDDGIGIFHRINTAMSGKLLFHREK